MNTQSAEIFLRCHRPGARNEDSRIQKAVKLASRDETLKARLSAQAGLDKHYAREIAALDVPADLAEKLDGASPQANARPSIGAAHFASRFSSPFSRDFYFSPAGAFISRWNRMQSFPARKT